MPGDVLLTLQTPEERRNARLVATYGITLEQYNQMLQDQHDACAICERPPAPGRVLVVDHNHITGAVRALLCSECNTGIGLLGDDTTILAAAITYLNAHGDYPRGGVPQPGNEAPDVAQTHPDLKEHDNVRK
jgi:hypothetical protein